MVITFDSVIQCSSWSLDHSDVFEPRNCSFFVVWMYEECMCNWRVTVIELFALSQLLNYRLFLIESVICFVCWIFIPANLFKYIDNWLCTIMYAVGWIMFDVTFQKYRNIFKSHTDVAYCQWLFVRVINIGLLHQCWVCSY